MDYCEFDHWEFVYDEVLHWTWRRFAADGHLRMPSRSTFASMDDCVADARLYGFVDHEAMDEGEVDASAYLDAVMVERLPARRA